MFQLRAVALDVDGVLTDDTFGWSEAADETKRFSFADVMGIARTKRLGIIFALVSGEDSPLVSRYARKLGIDHVFVGCRDKAAALRSFSETASIPLPEIGFVGNDVNDVDAMAIAGFAAAPGDAHASARAAAAVVTRAPGGRGAVREVLDLLFLAPPTAGVSAKAPAEDDESIRRQVQDHVRAIEETFVATPGFVSNFASAVMAAFRAGGKLLVFGNGGSAADAQHFAAEFVNRFRFDRPALPAIALTTDSSALTCIGNDSSFDEVFSRQVEALARLGDVVVAISTSGRSPNVLRGLDAAGARGAFRVALTGAKGRDSMAPRSDLCLAAASSETARIQEVHEFVLHLVAGLVEEGLHGGFRPEPGR